MKWIRTKFGKMTAAAKRFGLHCRSVTIAFVRWLYVNQKHEIFYLCGLSAIVAGVWQIDRPVAWIVGGTVLLVTSIVGAALPVMRSRIKDE